MSEPLTPPGDGQSHLSAGDDRYDQQTSVATAVILAVRGLLITALLMLNTGLAALAAAGPGSTTCGGDQCNLNTAHPQAPVAFRTWTPCLQTDTCYDWEWLGQLGLAARARSHVMPLLNLADYTLRAGALLCKPVLSPTCDLGAGCAGTTCLICKPGRKICLALRVSCSSASRQALCLYWISSSCSSASHSIFPAKSPTLRHLPDSREEGRSCFIAGQLIHNWRPSPETKNSHIAGLLFPISGYLFDMHLVRCWREKPRHIAW